MKAETALATVSLDVLRPERLSAAGVLRADGVVELDLGAGGPVEVDAPLLPNLLADNLYLGPRPLPRVTGVLRCEREALDLLLDEPAQLDALLAVAFGLDLDLDSAAALGELAAASVLHWRLRCAWGTDRSRTCEIVDAGPAGAWRVATLTDELGGGILLAPVTTTEIWRRLSAALPAGADLGDG
ncbi:MAG: hypothetical protein QOE11_2151 [Solirubrobacteraceae bacterium]|jgi:hypothetical protein|nr:hypothetical protein [Solirubrobacteraceae bacterium]